MTHFVPVLALRVPCPGNCLGKVGQLVPWSRAAEEPEQGTTFYVNVMVCMRHELLGALVLAWPVNQATHGGTRMNTGIQVWSLGGRRAGDAGKAETARVIAWQWGVRERKEPRRRVTFWLRDWWVACPGEERWSAGGWLGGEPWRQAASRPLFLVLVLL